MKTPRPDRKIIVFPVALAMLLVLAAATPALAQEKTAAPPGGQQRLGIPGETIRTVSNDEGYVIVGFSVANASVGQEWLLLEVGITTQPNVKATLTRKDFVLVTPDGKEVPLATSQEFNAAGGKLRSLNARANIQRQSINYFPAWAKNPCAMRFFPEAPGGQRVLSRDEVSLDSRRACVGRLYFHLPGGIQYGQYYLQVTFPNSVIKVPFRIMTKEEMKQLREKLKQMRKEAKEAGKK